MDLKTKYLGLDLKSPLMPGASPLVDDLGRVRRLEDAGAAAIVMHSLFEEQVVASRNGITRALEETDHASAEARSYFPGPSEYALGPEEYLTQLRRIKEAVGVPVIASLNGTTPSGWLEYARLIEQAGADALELNTWHVAADPLEGGGAVEQRTLEIVETVRSAVSIPIAVKLGPFYSALASVALRLTCIGASGLVLFNRFHEPDFDVESLEVRPWLRLSDSSELPLRLRWLAILCGRVAGSLAASGGVHTGLDAVKAVMAGADAVQVTSALLEVGPEHLGVIAREMKEVGERLGYGSADDMRGCLSLLRCPDPRAFERGNYVRALQGWRS